MSSIEHYLKHVLLCHLILAISVNVNFVFGVRQSELYEFGENVGDESLPKGDDVTVNITLQTPINLFGESYNSIFVSTNGLVSFLTPVERYINIQFPLNIPVIAPLYANADTTRGGHVHYRESNREADLSKSDATLRYHFNDLGVDFEPLGLFIVTWERIPMYGADQSTAEKVNTFQLAITTDREISFVEFLYHDGGIQWIQAPNANPYDSLPPVRAQAGIVSPSGRLFTLRGSGTDQVMNLDKWTNGDVAGQYVFKIGSEDGDQSEIVEQPRISKPDYGKSQGKTCAEGYFGCHSNAQCFDQPQGVCCVCRPSFIGNGISCLKSDQPIRLNGPLSINVNGVRLENFLFEGYAVVKDGRVYTAVDKLPPALAPSLQLLKPIESLPGWLFALTEDTNRKNGFQLTGGVVNHTATLTFSNSNVLRLHQIYKGPDAYDQIKVEVDISGRIPEIPPDGTIKQNEYYDEIYTKTEPGEYRSTNTHTYKLATGENLTVSVEQTISFEENCHSQDDSVPHRLVSNRNFVTHKPILRFAGFHKIGSKLVAEDPCIKGRIQCVANSSCLVQDDSFKCVCNSGFEEKYYGDSGDQLGCVDVNECQEETANCHENALCINEIGTFSCECHSGFSGDGTHCKPVKPSLTDQRGNLHSAIPTNMFCTDNDEAESCFCAQGYEIQTADNDLGIACVDIDECSRLSQVCSTYADCINFGGGFECRCHSGFQGDGRYCEPAGCDTIACPSGSVCDDQSGQPTCVCPPGYSGSPPSCIPEYQHSYPDGCISDDDCPAKAKCLSSLESRQTACTCPDGSTVEGYDSCNGRDLQISEEDSNPPSSQSQRLLRTCHKGDCWCPPGYEEDGQYCIKDLFYWRPVPTPPPPPPPPRPSSSTEDADRDEDVDSCHVLHNCHTNAQCIPDDGVYYRCVCNPWYEGDGYNCIKDPFYWRPVPTPAPPPRPGSEGSTEDADRDEDRDSCHVLRNCHTNAQCISVTRVDGGYRCMCNPGYEGDGYNCTESELSCHDADICHKNAVCMANTGQGSSHVCICSEGFIGDGFICYPSGQCTDDTDCGEYGVCEYNDERESHECECRRGYVKILGVCESEKNTAVCDACDTNADCVQKNGIYDCQCKDNFRGDGLTCIPEVQGCDALQDCDSNAQCLYDTEVEGYRCSCNPGFTGDGHSCEEIITCARNPTICSENARCLFVDGKYACTCNEGYFGNGTICKEAAVQDEQFLLLTKGGSILKVPFSPTRDDPGVPISIHESQVAVGITTDCVEGKVYWSDITGAQIKRAKYDGSEFEEFLNTTGESPEGLALDWINRQLYWVDPATDKISTINLDTKEVKVIIDRNLTNPRGIAVHPFRRKLYWSDWNRAAPKIEESNLDGSQRRDLVTGADVKLPNALTIDWDKDELCWSDAGTKTIDCMYLNRRVPNTVVDKVPYPFGIAISSDKYYWSDWNTLKIMSAPKINGSPISSIDVPLGGDDKPNGLTIVGACPR